MSGIKKLLWIKGKMVEKQKFFGMGFLDIVEKNLTDIVEKNQDKIKKAKIVFSDMRA